MSLLFFHQLPTFPFQISDLTQKCSAASLHIVSRWRARPRLVVTGQLLITIIRIWMCPGFLNITRLSKVTGNREQDLLHYIIHDIPKLVRGLENVTRAFSNKGVNSTWEKFELSANYSLNINENINCQSYGRLLTSQLLYLRRLKWMNVQKNPVITKQSRVTGSKLLLAQLWTLIIVFDKIVIIKEK